MTLTNLVVRDRYNGDASTVNFPIPFQFQDTDEIFVYLRDETTPTAITETLQTITTDYTLTGGTTDQPVYVTFVSAPSITQFPVIARITSKTQETDYISGDSFPAESHENALDHLAQISQELSDTLGRTILLPVTSTLSDLIYDEPQVYGVLRWDSLGTAIENNPIVATAPVVYTASTSTISMPAATAAINGYLSAAVYTDIYTRIAVIAAAGVPYVIYGTYGSPQSITAGGGITATTDQRQLHYVTGSGGAVDISANPQISAGTIDGQEMRLIGTDNTNTVTLDHGTGLIMNGSCVLQAGSSIDYSWSSGASAWIEMGRNGI